MTTLTALVRRHVLVAFFLLAYALSWAAFYALSGPGVFTLGPLFAALIVATIADGPGGLADLGRRLLRWRVPLEWYAAAVLVPVAIGLATILLVRYGSQVPTAVQPGSGYGILLTAATVVLSCDTLFEETGWRAFAMPRFPAYRSPLANTLVLGVLVAGWHLPVAMSERGVVAPYLIATVASMVVTNWVYYGARESALLAWTYHSAANTMGQYFGPMCSADRVRYFWSLAAVNCVAALAVVLATGAQLRIHARRTGLRKME